MGDELHHVLAVFLQHEADKGLGQVVGLLADGCQQQLPLLVLREHRVVNRLPQQRHLGVALGQRLHLGVDSLLDLRFGCALEQRPGITNRYDSYIHTQLPN